MEVTPLTPITSVKVLKNIPLDNSYKDTRKFSSVSDQITYFTSKAKYTFTDLAPVRLNNTIKLPINSDKIYDCNYIMFQNANFSTKWFYAFIKNIEYKNIEMCEITFEIDVLQTWHFDYILHPCMVLREHSVTDSIGDNLVTENIDFGYYVDETAETTNYFTSYAVVLATSWIPDGKTGGYKGGLFTGLDYVSGLVNNTEQTQNILDLLDNITSANKIDCITSIFMMPSQFVTNDSTPVQLRYDATMNNSKIGSYTPRNKKLLCYPYNFLNVYTPDGANNIYRYEYFQSNESCGFLLACGMSCNPEIILEPIAYNNQQFNVEESIVLGNFPQCAYSIDSFKAYLSQNAISTAISLASTGLAMSTGDPTALAMGGIGMANTINNAVMGASKPPQVRGSQTTSTFTATREKNFYFANRHITEEYAKILDGYFDVYGYATKKVKIPNVTGRPNWNYVQTENCNITGSIPFNDIAKIKSIFNSGITFWHTNDIGNYNLNNNV